MTKSLVMARHFKKAGFFVLGVTSPKYRYVMSRFSKAFEKVYVIPDARTQPEDYIKSLVQILKKYKVEWFIPICAPATELVDGRARDYLVKNKICKVLHFDEKTTLKLGNKFEFSKWAESLGLNVPEYTKITDPQQVIDYKISRGKRYVLKRIKYDPTRRGVPILLPMSAELDTENFLTSLNISTDNPWILQQFIEGREYCAHATVVDHKIKLYTDSKSSATQLNYQHVGQPLIYKWVEEFIKKSKLSTGQLCFDFIEDSDGNVFPIECNPRVHSAITSFYNQSDVIEACFGDFNSNRLPLIPTLSSRMTYWLPEEISRLFKLLINSDVFRNIKKMERGLINMLKGKYIIFSTDDPWPALGVHLHFISLLIPKIINGSRWTRLEFCIGKIVELEGD